MKRSLSDDPPPRGRDRGPLPGRRRPTLGWLHAAVILLAPWMAGAEGPESPPSVVLILADDLGWGDISHHRGPIPTPAIDRIFREGTELETLLVSPLCSPTRAALLTGRHPVRTGLVGVLNPEIHSGLEPEEVALAESFGAAGYATAIFGKWHLGDAQSVHYAGFDEFCGLLPGGADYFTRRHLNPGRHLSGRRPALPFPDSSIWMCGGEITETAGYTTFLIRDLAVEFIRRQRQSPFFLYLPFTAPHTPLQAPPEYVERVPAAITGDDERLYAAMIIALDDAVGAILDELERSQISRRTVVVFASDNGGAQESSNRPFRGGKGTLYEGGVRSPTALRWPGRLAAGARLETMAAVEDLAPTLLALAGVPRLEGPPLDGHDLSGLLEPGSGRREVREQYTWIARQGDAIRTPRWKLVRTLKGAELFDLSADPEESQDLAASHPRVAGELTARLDAWEASIPAYPSHLPVDDVSPPRPRGQVLAIRLAANVTPGFTVSLAPRFPSFELPLAIAPGDRLEYDLMVAEGPTAGFFLDFGGNPSSPAPFRGVHAVDQFGNRQTLFAGFPQARGRWERRVIGLANYAPSPVRYARIAFGRVKREQLLYLDNVALRRANGDLIEFYTGEAQQIAVRPPASAVSWMVREMALSEVPDPSSPPAADRKRPATPER